MIRIPRHLLEAVAAHAADQYPRECCGLLCGPVAIPDAIDTLHRCRNAQDDLHARDPVQFSRTSLTAFFIDPRDLIQIERANEKARTVIRAIYHSHPDADAYFSTEDQYCATGGGHQPLHPGIAHLVVSVRNGVTREMRLFHWNGPETGFVGASIDWL